MGAQLEAGMALLPIGPYPINTCVLDATMSGDSTDHCEPLQVCRYWLRTRGADGKGPLDPVPEGWVLMSTDEVRDNEDECNRLFRKWMGTHLVDGHYGCNWGRHDCKIEPRDNPYFLSGMHALIRQANFMDWRDKQRRELDDDRI